MPFRQAGGQPCAANSASAATGSPGGSTARNSSAGSRGLFGMLPSSAKKRSSGPWVICASASGATRAACHGSAVDREGMMAGIDRLRDFVQGMTRLADAGADEAAMLAGGAALLRDLVGEDDWLPTAFATPGPASGPGPGYRQYLLHCDPAERFSVVSFVWAPGQRT